MSRDYDGAADAMKEKMEPKTPCRNMETRPCVRQLGDGSTRYPKQECLPHRCARVPDRYEEGSIPHEFAVDSDGELINFEMVDYHDGPYCVRCEQYFCRSCRPGVRTEPCEVQDVDLF